MLVRYVTFACFALLLITPSRSWALVQEAFGNGRLAGFDAWAGITEVVNQKTRVYLRASDASDDLCFFRGNTKQLNEALRNFAKMDGKVREVVLLPGPGIGYSFDRKKRILHNWQLAFVRGRATVLYDLDKGDLIWSTVPVLTVYIGGDVKLDELEVPAGIVLTELSDLSLRYREAIATSTDENVRGLGAKHLSRLSPYEKENLAIVAKLLDDKSNWVRRKAAQTLPEFGVKAEQHLPTLRRCLDSDDTHLKQSAEESINAIESATENPSAEKEFLATQESIMRFCKMKPKRKAD